MEMPRLSLSLICDKCGKTFELPLSSIHCYCSACLSSGKNAMEIKDVLQMIGVKVDLESTPPKRRGRPKSKS